MRLAVWCIAAPRMLHPHICEESIDAEPIIKERESANFLRVHSFLLFFCAYPTSNADMHRTSTRYTLPSHLASILLRETNGTRCATDRIILLQKPNLNQRNLEKLLQTRSTLYHFAMSFNRANERRRRNEKNRRRRRCNWKRGSIITKYDVIMTNRVTCIVLDARCNNARSRRQKRSPILVTKRPFLRKVFEKNLFSTSSSSSRYMLIFDILLE